MRSFCHCACPAPAQCGQLGGWMCHQMRGEPSSSAPPRRPPRRCSRSPLPARAVPPSSSRLVSHVGKGVYEAAWWARALRLRLGDARGQPAGSPGSPAPAGGAGGPAAGAPGSPPVLAIALFPHGRWPGSRWGRAGSFGAFNQRLTEMRCLPARPLAPPAGGGWGGPAAGAPGSPPVLAIALVLHGRWPGPGWGRAGSLGAFNLRPAEMRGTPARPLAPPAGGGRGGGARPGRPASRRGFPSPYSFAVAGQCLGRVGFFLAFKPRPDEMRRVLSGPRAPPAGRTAGGRAAAEAALRLAPSSVLISLSDERKELHCSG